MNISGTTFSGLSTRTTLGNTFRSICYVYYYLIDSDVSDTPWDDNKLYVAASGDDTVIFCSPDLEHKIMDCINKHTTRTNKKYK